MPRLLLLALIALVLPAAEPAAFPGTNGRILFTQELEPIDRGSQPRSYVCASALNGVRPLKVADAPEAQSIEFPAVDPGGDRVAYSRIGNIFISAVDGRGQRFLAAGTMPAWTPDGKRLFYANGGDLYSIADGMFMMRTFTSGPSYDQMPSVSPDGSVVAFVRGPVAGPSGDQLVLRDVLTGSERVLVSTPGIAAPDWSPDGGRIVFAIRGTIDTIASDGTDLRALTSGGDAAEPAYSPDGALIAFERDGDIWTMTTSGSALVNVTRSPVRERQPAWQTGTAYRPAGSDLPCAIVGTDQAEELVGSEYDDVFYDLGGDDTVRGLGGEDRIFDGEGSDRIEGGDGADRIFLRFGSNVTFGGPGDDTISGAAALTSPEAVGAPQQIFGEDGADVLTGGVGADRITGGTGKDLLTGLDGPDTLAGGSQPDRLVGGRGEDALNGGSGDDRLSGGLHADYLLGDAGIDVFAGDQGDDLLLARDGSRELVDGGAGFDRARLDRTDRRRSVERAIR